jgi:hypothetical protein
MPQMGYDTKTDRLTDCQSQCDFDFDFDLNSVSLLAAFSSAHCVCKTLLKAVLYLESVNWVRVIIMAILSIVVTKCSYGY